jgi:ribose transport system substrate-binding protein
MKLLSGGNIMAMDVGEDIDWLAYATVDQVGRAVTGAPLVKSGNEQTALRIFTKSNIAQDGTPPTGNLGYGTAYVTGYKALWGAP